MRRSMVAAAALAAAAVVGYALLRPEREAAVPPPAPLAPAAAPAAPPPAAASAALDTPKAVPIPSQAGAVIYPDGSRLPALNGVTTDLKLDWGIRPFTKVVGIENGPNGWQWYVHENGTRSTTVMNTMNGVLQPMGLVAEPEQSKPIFPGSLPPGGSGSGTPR